MRGIVSKGFGVALLTFAVVLSSTWAQAPAQTDNRPDTIMRVTTRMVLVDLVALDSSGKPVPGLTQKDFSISENGVPQKIASFTFRTLDSDTAPKSKPPLLQAHVTTNRPDLRRPDAPAVVLLLDGLNTGGPDQTRVRQQMLRYVAMHFDPRVKMAVMVLTSQLHVLQDFTSDPALLKAALDRYRAQESAASRSGPPEDIMNNLPQTPILPSQAGSAASQGSPDSDPAAPRSSGGSASTIAEMLMYLRQRFENEAQNYARDTRVSMTLDALSEIARYMAGQKGRKSLLWFSAGFPISVSGTDAADLGTNRLYGEQVRRTTNLLSDAHIAIYTIDARGLTTGNLSNITESGPKGPIAGPELNRALAAETYARFNEENTLEQVALDTGGQAFRDNDLARAIQMSIRDTANYYLIGYYPTDKKWDGKFRKIQMKVDRPGVHLQHRSGYFATDPFNWRKAGGEEALTAAVKRDPLLATEVLFFARALPPPRNEDLKVEFLVDPNTVTFETAAGNEHYCNLQFEVQAFSPDGKLVRAEVQSAEAPLKAETFERVSKQGIPMAVPIKLPAGKYILRLGVRDNRTGLFGTAELPMEIAK